MRSVRQDLRRVGSLQRALLIVAAGWLALSGRADTNYWTGAESSDWFNTNNWSLTNLPAAGDDVVITNAGNNVLLTNFTPYLASFTLTNKTLTFSNWDTILSASNVTIWSKGTITVANAFTDAAGQSNRVCIACSNFTLNAGGVINVNALGFLGGYGAAGCTNGFGPGGGQAKSYATGSLYGGGGGHGGRGGHSTNNPSDCWIYAAGGAANDAADEPVIPGSGGGVGMVSSAYKNGGNGGGLVRVEADGLVTIEGTITANGGSPTVPGGAGSGGGIYIGCRAFAGSVAGLLSAVGANSGSSASGGGGGGRIAVVYSNLVDNPAVRMTAERGFGGYGPLNTEYWPTSAQKGTISFSDAGLWEAHVSGGVVSGISGEIVFLEGTNLSYESLTITNASVSMRNVSLTATNLIFESGGNLTIWSGRVDCVEDLVIRNNGSLILYPGSNNIRTLTVQPGGTGYVSQLTCESALVGGALILAVDPATLICSGNLTVTNGGRFYVYSGATNAATTNYGALVRVDGDLTVYTDAWIYPYSNATNGGSPYFALGNLAIANGGGISAYGRGFAGGRAFYYINDIRYYNSSYNAFGPGAGFPGGSLPTYGGGGGYGGKGGWGGKAGATGGVANGSANFPMAAGSGGAGSFSSSVRHTGVAGGLVRLEIAGLLTLDGSVTASGDTVGDASIRSGGAGGGINIICHDFSNAATAQLTANGASAAGDCGGGGGGRIAFWRGVSRGMRTRYLDGQEVRTVRVSTNQPDWFAGSVSVARGTGITNTPPVCSDPGTIRFIEYVRDGAMFSISGR